MKTDIHFLSYLAQFFLEREMFHTKGAEKIKTHIFFENSAFYEIMRKNIVEPDRPQIRWRMRIAFWILKATTAHSEYVITGLSVTSYVHFLSC